MENENSTQKQNKNELKNDYEKTGDGKDGAVLTEASMSCPNCGSKLEGRKCKLLCTRPGCGYMVTCSEW